MPREKPTGVRLRRQSIPVTPLQWAYLTDQWRPGEEPPEGSDPAELFFFEAEVRHGPGPASDRLPLSEAWQLVREPLLEAWTEHAAGTRPAAWWRWDAPEPRRRLGGVGDPLPEVLAHVERLEYGIPADWLTADWVATYRALHKDPTYMPPNRVHDRVGAPVNPEDPPVFESESAYLDRLDLLTEAERAELAVQGWPDWERIG